MFFLEDFSSHRNFSFWLSVSQVFFIVIEIPQSCWMLSGVFPSHRNLLFLNQCFILTWRSSISCSSTIFVGFVDFNFVPS